MIKQYLASINRLKLRTFWDEDTPAVLNVRLNPEKSKWYLKIYCPAGSWIAYHSDNPPTVQYYHPGIIDKALKHNLQCLDAMIDSNKHETIAYVSMQNIEQLCKVVDAQLQEGRRKPFKPPKFARKPYKRKKPRKRIYKSKRTKRRKRGGIRQPKLHLYKRAGWSECGCIVKTIKLTQDMTIVRCKKCKTTHKYKEWKKEVKNDS